jgi:hypothetical protein
MKIMMLKEFLQHNTGDNIVFSMVSDSGCFGPIMTRVEVTDSDFCFTCPASELNISTSDAYLDFFDGGFEASKYIEMDQSCVSRWGMHDEGQLFAVYSRKEIEAIISCLKTTLK